MVDLVKTAQVVEDLLKERAQVNEQITEIDTKYSAQVEAKEAEFRGAVSELDKSKDEALAALPDEEVRYNSEVSSKLGSINNKIGTARFWIGYYLGGEGPKHAAETIFSLRKQYFAAEAEVADIRKEYGARRVIEIEVEDGDNTEQIIYRGRIGSLYKGVARLERENAYLLRRARSLIRKSRNGLETLLDKDSDMGAHELLDELGKEDTKKIEMDEIIIYTALTETIGNLAKAYVPDISKLQLQYMVNESQVKKDKDFIASLEKERDEKLSSPLNNVLALRDSIGSKIRAHREKIAGHRETIAKAEGDMSKLNEEFLEFDLHEREGEIGRRYLSEKSELKMEYGSQRDKIMRTAESEMQPLREQRSDLDMRIAEARKALLAEEASLNGEESHDNSDSERSGIDKEERGVKVSPGRGD